VLAVRDLGKGEAAAEGLRGGRGRVSVVELDLADLDSVAACAKAVADRLPRPARGDLQRRRDGRAVRAHRPGLRAADGHQPPRPRALVTALWPQLHAAAGRVVVVTSIAARSGTLSAATTRDELVAPPRYSPMAVYASTKQANLLFAQSCTAGPARPGPR
jgi:hypothetical protein